LYRTIMDTSRDLIVMTERDGQPVYISPSSMALLGFAPEELLQDKGLCTVHPDDRAGAIEAFHRSATDSDSDSNGVEVRCKHRNGEWRTFECVANWVHEDGEPLRCVLMFRDITKRKLVDEERRRAMQALAGRERDLRVALTALEKSHHELAAAQQQLIQASRMDAVGQLAAGVAHEVKNPLTVLLLGLEYLRKSSTAPPGEVLDDMEDAVHRANDVVKRLLEFATPAELTREVSDLHEVIEGALRLVQHQLARACVTVIKDFDHTLRPLLLDRKQIEQAVVSLLMSAIQNMQAGGTIHMSTSRRGAAADGVVVFEIEDTGSGGADDLRRRLSDPAAGARSKADNPTLGLRIIEGILELHGAKIELRNRPEGGVHVTMTFRLAG
jgi:PAS domain S-box-containing protein